MQNSGAIRVCYVRAAMKATPRCTLQILLEQGVLTNMKLIPKGDYHQQQEPTSGWLIRSIFTTLRILTRRLGSLRGPRSIRQTNDNSRTSKSYPR